MRYVNTIFVTFMVIAVTFLSVTEIQAEEKISVTMSKVDLELAINSISNTFGKNFIAQPNISGVVSFDLEFSNEEEAMAQIEEATGLILASFENTWLLLTEENYAPTVEALARPVNLELDQIISIHFSKISMHSVFAMLAKQSNFSIEIAPEVTSLVSLKFNDTSVTNIINMLAAVHGLQITLKDNTMSVRQEHREMGEWLSKISKPLEEPELRVLGIFGNNEARSALIKHQNRIITVSKNDVVHGQFIITEIRSDRVVIYRRSTQIREVLRISD